MITPYICNGTCVRTSDGREGMVVSAIRNSKVIVIREGKRIYTESKNNVVAVSYKNVEMED